MGNWGRFFAHFSKIGHCGRFLGSANVFKWVDLGGERRGKVGKSGENWGRFAEDWGSIGEDLGKGCANSGKTSGNQTRQNVLNRILS